MRLTILSRLILGYAVLLVLAAAMSIYAVFLLGRVADVTRSIIGIDSSLVNLQKELTDALLSETRYEKKYLILQDRALLDGFFKSNKDFERALAEARLLNSGPETRAALHKAFTHHQAYQALFREEAEHLASGHRYDTARYTREKERAANAAIRELISVRDLGQKSIVDKVRALSEAGDRARTIASAAVGSFLFFGILLAVLITRSITGPLGQIQKKTREIAEGKFGPALPVASPPEIGELAQAFNAMCSRLKEVDKMKMDFFALMSHELRTPLTSIKEGTNLFLEGRAGQVTAGQKKLLTIIAEESNRLIALVASVLDLSRLESGALSYHFSSADLAPLIQMVLRETQPLAESKKIGIESSIAELPNLPLDPERILQALRNIIGNALKFTPGCGRIAISAHSRNGWVIVSISDTGPGVPGEYAAAIFEKFRQVPGSGRLKGTGLGLALTKEIIQGHGGAIWVENSAGSGSTFTFRLPV